MANPIVQQFHQIAKEGQEVVLPFSGIKVRVRPVSLTGLVRRGLIPSELYAMAMAGFPELEALTNAQTLPDLNRVTDMSLGMDKWHAAVLATMFVDPPFNADPAAAPNENELVLENFAGVEGDIQFLMGLATLPIKNWEDFRERQVRSIQSVDDREGIEYPSE